ncbi:MAG: nucleotide pyrophosphohydrolase [Opitutales bacterium]|nr:nucleotide pyrophosphohydrolase [Opitutales bacterium]
MDLTSTLTAIRDFRDERDWRQFHNPKDLSAALSIEAAELMECFLWIDKSEVDQMVDQRRIKIEEEVADIAVYLFHLVDVLQIDLPNAINRKLEQNRAKYPVDKSRGNAKKYTEL